MPKYCRSCGAELSGTGKFCKVCGEPAEGRLSNDSKKMNCPKCHSNNIVVYNREKKRPTFAYTMIFVCVLYGIWLINSDWKYIFPWYFGDIRTQVMVFVIGFFSGIIPGALIGLLISALTPKKYESICTCQNCGHTFDSKTKREK